MYYCHNCGTPLQEDAKFCFNCGAEQPTEAAPAPQGHAAAPAAQATRAPAHARPAAPRPAAAPAAKPAESAPARQPSAAPKPQTAQPQATLGELTHTWENVKISGEFKNGVGTITITFS